MGGGNPSPDLTLYDLVTIREGLWFWSSFRYMVSESHWEQSNMAMFSVPVWTLKKVESGLKPPTMRCKTMTIVGKWNSNYSIPVCFLFWSCPIPISPFRMIYLSLSPPKKDILFGKYNYKWTNMNIKTHTSLYIDHHRIPPLHRPPKKFPPVFFVLQKKRSLVASVPKISGGKVQRWSQASSTGRSVWCGAWLLCLMVSQEKRRGRSCFEGIFLVGKTRSFSGLFLFFFRCGGSLFLVENHLEERCLKSRVGISIFLWGVQNMAKNLAWKKTHKYGTHFTQKNGLELFHGNVARFVGIAIVEQITPKGSRKRRNRNA